METAVVLGGLGTHIEDVPPTAIATLLKVSSCTSYSQALLIVAAVHRRQLLMALLHHYRQVVCPVPVPRHIQNSKVLSTSDIWLHCIHRSVFRRIPHLYRYSLPTIFSILECVGSWSLWQSGWFPNCDFIHQHSGRFGYSSASTAISVEATDGKAEESQNHRHIRRGSYVRVTRRLRAKDCLQKRLMEHLVSA